MNTTLLTYDNSTWNTGAVTYYTMTAGSSSAPTQQLEAKAKSELDLLDERVEQACAAGRMALGVATKAAA